MDNRSHEIGRYIKQLGIDRTELLIKILTNIRDTDKDGSFKVKIDGHIITMKQQG